MLFLFEEAVVELVFVVALVTAAAILAGTVFQLLRDGAGLRGAAVPPPAQSARKGRAVERRSAARPSPVVR